MAKRSRRRTTRRAASSFGRRSRSTRSTSRRRFTGRGSSRSGRSQTVRIVVQQQPAAAPGIVASADALFTQAPPPRKAQF